MIFVPVGKDIKMVTPVKYALLKEEKMDVEHHLNENIRREKI